MAIAPVPFDRASVLGSDAVLSALRAHASGLSAKEAARRLALAGPNALPEAKRGGWRVLGRQFVSPFSLLLVGSAVLSCATDDLVGAYLIGAFVLFNATLGFFQEYRAERAARALRSFWRTSSRVRRDGKEETVPSETLVPGDIVLLRAGDRVPADVRFLQTRGLFTDESVLTGESQPTSKDARRMVAAPAGMHDAANVGFSGTVVSGGEAEAVVISTGVHSAAGQTIALAEELRPPSTFERDIGKFAGFTLKLVCVTVVLLVAFNVWLKGTDGIEHLILFAVALTVGVIPEALPVVTSVALSSGALHMARKGVVVKRLSAISDLGGIDVLCTDKTGTMTQNVLRVVDVLADDKAACLRAAVLGCDREGRDAFDAALLAKAPSGVRGEWELSRTLGDAPFDADRRRNTAVLRLPDGERLLVTRGAPEEVAALCADAPHKKSLLAALKKEGCEGNRVLAIAAKRHVHGTNPLAEEHGLSWLGMVSFRDPLKEDAAAAVRKAEQLGVQIKVLTGDAADVAGAVAHRLGLVEDPSHVLTGAAFMELSPAQQRRAVEQRHVFARLSPAQKFAILDLLKEKHAVGFLGEGFNDAPGLKVSHAAIAVAGASDAAKDVSDVILTERSLLVVCDGIEEGRRIAANVSTYLKVTLASNFGNFYSLALASLFIKFLPMLPVQILLLNLLSDLPMVAIAGDRPDPESLRKPHRSDARQIIVSATVLGSVSSVFDITVFLLFRRFGEGPLQTSWFVISVLTELALIYVLRSRKPFWRSPAPSASLAAITVTAAILAAFAPLLPWSARLFHFVTPEPSWMLGGLGLVAAYMLASELAKAHLVRKAV